jgi:nicotinamide mononucleotide transporter
MSSILSVHNVFFTIFGYSMSYIEFVGTLLYIWSVWLIIKRSILTWPVGIVSVLLYMALFYQIRLYSDALEQVYYLGASFYGWWYWSKTRQREDTIADVTFSSHRAILAWVVITAAFSALLAGIICRVHIWAPAFFPEAASYPYLDALTTVMSFVAMWLMARKHIESWIYWIIIDVIGIGLYYAKEVKFISFLYAILLVLASRGLITWTRTGSQFARNNEHPWSLPNKLLQRTANRRR